jgi:hypothetical protein
MQNRSLMQMYINDFLNNINIFSYLIQYVYNSPRLVCLFEKDMFQSLEIGSRDRPIRYR